MECIEDIHGVYLKKEKKNKKYPELCAGTIEVSHVLVKGDVERFIGYKYLINNNTTAMDYYVNSKNKTILAYAMNGDINIYLPQIQNFHEYEVTIKDASFIYENKKKFVSKRFQVNIFTQEGELIEPLDANSKPNHVIFRNYRGCLTLKYCPPLTAEGKGVWFIVSSYQS